MRRKTAKSKRDIDRPKSTEAIERILGSGFVLESQATLMKNFVDVTAICRACGGSCGPYTLHASAILAPVLDESVIQELDHARTKHLKCAIKTGGRRGVQQKLDL